MIATAPTTEPTTLVEVAHALDECTAQIESIRSEMESEERAAMEALGRLLSARKAEIGRLEDGARDLVAMQTQLMQRAYPGLFPKPAKRQRGSKPANGAVPPNIAARKRNAAIRRFAAEKGLDCPATGNEFSQELRDTFDRESGYQG
jgi:hypothetical protein